MTVLPRFFIFAIAVIVSAIALARIIKPPPLPVVELPEFLDLAFGTPPPAPPEPPESTPSASPAGKPGPVAKVIPLPAPPPPKAPASAEATAGKPEGTAPLPAAPPQPQLSDAEFYARFSRAVVQIFCSTPREVFAASGVIMNEGGLVLTNAHVADVIRRAGEENCQARGGNPAERFAGVEILFSASTTPKIATTDVPERDIAFLRLVDPKESFTVAPVGFAIVERGALLLTLGYPSEFLQGLTTAANSNLVFSSLRVDGYADIDGNTQTAEGYVSRGGIILQQGSSGTALFTRSGALVGLIFATTKGETTDDREGLALMIPYIDRILRLETGRGLLEFIAER